MYSWCFGCHIDLNYIFANIIIELKWRRPMHEEIYLYNVQVDALTHPINASNPYNSLWPTPHI